MQPRRPCSQELRSRLVAFRVSSISVRSPPSPSYIYIYLYVCLARCESSRSNVRDKCVLSIHHTRYRSSVSEALTLYGSLSLCVWKYIYAGPTSAPRRLENRVETGLREMERRGANGAVSRRDKADRATVEQAIDPRTRMVLFKMLNRRILQEINGCVSTGKMQGSV